MKTFVRIGLVAALSFACGVADIHAQEKSVALAMHQAAGRGDVDAMKRLKEQGVDINVRHDGFTEETPMHKAAQNGHIHAMEWLKEQGANVNVRDKAGKTPLSVARTDEAKEWLRANGAK